MSNKGNIIMRIAVKRLKVLTIVMKKWNPFSDNHFLIVPTEDSEKVL